MKKVIIEESINLSEIHSIHKTTIIGHLIGDTYSFFILLNEHNDKYIWTRITGQNNIIRHCIEVEDFKTIKDACTLRFGYEELRLFAFDSISEAVRYALEHDEK